MISTMVYSLKDAAERDRLAGTTFIQMNVMVGLWAVLVGLGVSLGYSAYTGVEMYAFAIPFFIKALKSQKEKHEKNEKLS
jgi:type IV secretory pathway TrbD component